MRRQAYRRRRWHMWVALLAGIAMGWTLLLLVRLAG
jgi:hypothetical protein